MIYKVMQIFMEDDENGDSQTDVECVGEFKNLEEAKSLKKELEDEKISCYHYDIIKEGSNNERI